MAEAMAESDESGGAGAGRRRLWIAGLVIAAVHLSLVAYAFPTDVVFGDAGFNKPDYHTHWQQAQVLLELYRETGRLWAYDPGLLAGHPVGLFFDVDNKLHFLWVLALTRLGVGAAAAFNLFAVASSLLAPLSLAGAARLLGYRAPAALAVAGVTVLLWHFDSTLHFLWTAGMLSFATACHLALLCVGLMWATLRGPRPWLAFAGLAVVLPLAHLTHVWAFAILVVPLVGLYLGHARRLDLAGHLRVWLAVAATLAVNAYWLLPALRHLHWLTESAVVGQATPLYLVTDYLEVLVNPVNTGYAEPRTLFRFAALLGAAATLVRWRRGRDPRFAVCASTLAWLVGMSYFGTFIPLLKLTEPYRFASSATLLAGLLAAPWLVEHVRLATLRRLSGPARGLVALLALLVVPRIFSEVTTFVPELQRPLLEGTAIDHRGARVPTPIHSMRLPAVDDHLKNLARHLDELPGDGRVLVQLWPVGEYLRGALKRPVIGGFPDRRVIHETANLFRLRPDEPRYYGDELGAYLERYHIDYVVFSPPFFPEIERRLDLLEPVRVFGFHKIFHVRRPSTYVVGGRATIDAGFDRIAVQGARADDGRSLVLRYHYMEGMTCAPDCTIERAPIPYDPVGFIRVTAAGERGLPPSFVIRREGP